MNFETIAVAIQEDLKAIRSDIVEIRQNMATKEDVGRLRMETKADIRQIRREMATKADLGDFPTYNDVRSLISEAKDEIFKEMDKFKYAPENRRLGRAGEKTGDGMNRFLFWYT